MDGGGRAQTLLQQRSGPRSILEGSGIGLRAPHVQEVLLTRPPVAWFEVHAENYFGGKTLRALLEIRRNYPVSIHGVGLSLGADEPLDYAHLHRLRELVSIVLPALVSEHLAFSGLGGLFTNALLPIPYDDEALDVMSAKVDRVQEWLGRQILIENPAGYLEFRHSTLSEVEFLQRLVERTGCGLLLDLTNLHVSSTNLGFQATEYLAGLPAAAVKEIHLAGCTAKEVSGATVLLDSHASPVPEPVWALYQASVDRLGAVPTLVEWDTALPSLETLMREAALANRLAAQVA